MKESIEMNLQGKFRENIEESGLDTLEFFFFFLFLVVLASKTFPCKTRLWEFPLWHNGKESD